MQVTATANGYYQTLRYEGDVFNIKDKTHLGSWMQVIEQKVIKAEPKPKKKAKKKAK